MKGTRALIVEDDRIAARSLKTMLESFGCIVVSTASEGAQAIQLAQEHKPDIALVDIWLKGDLDGIDTARQMQSIHPMPIIYLTAYADDETLARAKVTEPQGYLVKPVDPRDLHIAIDMALYRHRVKRAREQLVNELHEALSTVRHLSGLLRVCSHCNRVQASDGSWQTLESTIRAHPEANFAVWLCADCAQELCAARPQEDAHV